MAAVSFMGSPLVNGLVVEGQSCHVWGSHLFAAMHPSGVAAHQCARAVVSLLLTSVVAPVHGCFFHFHLRWQAAAKRPGFATLGRGLTNRSRWKPGTNRTHSHTPSKAAAAIATAARLAARRISLRTAVLAHVWSSFSGVVMALSFDLLSPSTPLNKLENGCDATRIPV